MLVMNGFAAKQPVAKDADATQLISPRRFKCLNMRLVFLPMFPRAFVLKHPRLRGEEFTHLYRISCRSGKLRTEKHRKSLKSLETFLGHGHIVRSIATMFLHFQPAKTIALLLALYGMGI